MTPAASEGLRVGLVGCGVIGRRRIESLRPGDVLVGCVDVLHERAAEMAWIFGGVACDDVAALVSLEPDVVIVATIHSELAALACASLAGGAHVLVEKPAGIGLGDIDSIADTAERFGRLVKVGFNHRFHPGIARAISEARTGMYGDLLYLRGRYGHGGRLGYEKEWRADPQLSGGGEIVDQGVHLLDLSYWLLGPLPLRSGMLRTQFWDAPVDDNAVLLLGERGGVGDASPFALLHVSWTEWKNTFSIEIACHDAKLAVDGLGRSYGPECLRIYRMRPELGPPDLEEVTYEDRDDSWSAEWRYFAGAVETGDGRDLLGGLDSAALRVGSHREGADILNEEVSLSGHRIVTTGASGEIGRAVTTRLSELGATIVLIGRDRTALEARVSALSGGPHEVLVLDVRDEKAWHQSRETLGGAGPIHGLVTAAGVLGPIGTARDTPIDLFRDTFEVNVTGTLLAIRSCLDGLASTAGSIVTYSGGGATSPLPRYTAYAISKAAVVRMTENLAVELIEEGVRVNAVAPGFVAGPIHDATVAAGPDAVGAAYYARTVAALNSGGDPPDRAANLTAFLLSDASRGISGKLLSAVWDPWEQPEFQERLRSEADLATLRRIDDQFFTVARNPQP